MLSISVTSQDCIDVHSTNGACWRVSNDTATDYSLAQLLISIGQQPLTSVLKLKIVARNDFVDSHESCLLLYCGTIELR